MSNGIKNTDNTMLGVFLLGFFLATGFWLFVLLMLSFAFQKDVEEGIDRGFRYHDAKTGELIWRDDNTERHKK